MTTTLSQVKQLLEDNPDWGRKRVSEHFGIGEKTARRLIGLARQNSNMSESKPVERKNELTVDLGRNSGTATSLSRNIKTVDDLLKFAEVDTKVWEVERVVLNKWEVGTKGPDGDILTAPLFQVKAWLKKKVAGAREGLEEIFRQIQESAPKLPAIKYSAKSGNCLEIAIADIHHGKLCWGQECGTDYDVSIASRLHEEATQYLLETSGAFRPEKILWVVGNDYFHVANEHNTTTAGTPQDTDGRWQRSFRSGAASIIRSIEMSRKIAPVDVMIVSGNHDSELSWTLGEVLSARFHNTPGVAINNDPMKRKYYRHGQCLLGLTHGSDEKFSTLPILMATEQPKIWGETKFREAHLGHYHSKRESVFRTVEDFNGIRVRVLPSLTPPDAWHFSHGYGSLRAAEAFVLNKDQGFIANLSWSPNGN